MTKHDRLFLATLLCAAALIAAVMMDNVSSKATATANNLRTDAIRQRLMDMKLPLHEGKYWRPAHE